jgi:hypothetical protein
MSENTCVIINFMGIIGMLMLTFASMFMCYYGMTIGYFMWLTMSIYNDTHEFKHIASVKLLFTGRN